MSHNNISRRKFLNVSSCAGLSSLTCLNTLLNLKAVNAACGLNYSFNDYKALVCVLLPGGNDSFNMLIPTDNSAYNDYVDTRGTLALPTSDILNLNNVPYGINGAMTEVQELFNSQNLSFLANVGTLVEPGITSSNYETAMKPSQLFSHNDQIMQWQNAVYDKTHLKGWGGRIADLIYQGNVNQNVSMNISLDGGNIFQTGQSVVEMSTNYSRANTINMYRPDASSLPFVTRTNAIDSMLAQAHADIFKKTYNSTIKKSIEMAVELNEQVFDYYSQGNWPCTGSSSSEFQAVAKIISRQNALGFNRQIFFIQYGGWDLHDDGISRHADLLGGLSKELGDFYECLETIGKQDEVLTFTMSEFGRTLTSNGNGTDHGWGGNVMVMGGPNVINGGQIFGSYPSLAVGSPQVAEERGMAIPTSSTDEYFAELARWFGLSYSDIASDICTGLPNFYNHQTATQSPIGFAQI